MLKFFVCSSFSRRVKEYLSLFQLFGGACIGGGIFVILYKNDILILARSATEGAVDSVDTPSLLESAAYVLIATGAFVVFISFVGCCGACLKSKCLLRIVSVKRLGLKMKI